MSVLGPTVAFVRLQQRAEPAEEDSPWTPTNGSANAGNPASQPSRLG